MSNGHIQVSQGLLKEGESHISKALMDIDAQVTILPGPLEGRSVQIKLIGFGHGSQQGGEAKWTSWMGPLRQLNILLLLILQLNLY